MCCLLVFLYNVRLSVVFVGLFGVCVFVGFFGVRSTLCVVVVLVFFVCFCALLFWCVFCLVFSISLLLAFAISVDRALFTLSC